MFRIFKQPKPPIRVDKYKIPREHAEAVLDRYEDYKRASRSAADGATGVQSERLRFMLWDYIWEKVLPGVLPEIQEKCPNGARYDIYFTSYLPTVEVTYPEGYVEPIQEEA